MSQAPFEVGDRVVRINKHAIKIKLGDVLTVASISKCGCGTWRLSVEEDRSDYSDCNCIKCQKAVKNSETYEAKNFRKVNPYSNSVSKELAEKAMNVGDGADRPIKIKELETANN